MSTPILPFEVWESGTNQNSIPANDNSLRWEILSGLVIADDVVSQPVSPTDGDIYIIPASATGTQWATFGALDLALFRGGTWYAYAPVEGITVNLDGSLYGFDGAEYVALGGGGGGSGVVVTIVPGPGVAVDDTDPANPIVSATGSAPEWGDITGTLASQTDLQAALDSKGSAGIPQNIKSAAYTLVLADANKHILHPSSDTTARTMTIPANSSVAYPIGTALTFVNQNAAGVMTIAINSGTMRLAGAGTTGSRTLSANGIATAIKITATEWIINGTGLT